MGNFESFRRTGHGPARRIWDLRKIVQQFWSAGFWDGNSAPQHEDVCGQDGNQTCNTHAMPWTLKMNCLILGGPPRIREAEGTTQYRGTTYIL